LKRNKFYKYPYKYDKTGIIIVAEGLLYDYFRISGVVEGSAGDKAGAKENDRILKINGVDLAYKKIGEVMQLLDDSGRTVELEVLRNQKIIQIKVHNYRL
jgi:C-terminal processing protease CtpA/Prc